MAEILQPFSSGASWKKRRSGLWVTGETDKIESEKFKYAPRVTLLADREWLNLESIIDFANKYPAHLQLGGLITAGGELDEHIIRLADKVDGMKSHGKAVPLIWHGRGAPTNTGFQFFSTNTRADFRFLRAPYYPSKLKDQQYRRRYSHLLKRYAKSTEPAIIFLSNLKVILDSAFVNAFRNRIVNVHPSVLPQLKGYRSELRAQNGEFPEAAGYTFHMVDKDLDGGPTLFRQRVLLDEENPSELKMLGEKAYKALMEEKLRLKIITAQSQYTPVILAILASPIERKVVQDEKAFEAESRPDFMGSDEYQQVLCKEYEEWKESNDSSISYSDWHVNHRKPYSRILFNYEDNWQTLEAVFQAPEISPIQQVEPITYQIWLSKGDLLVPHHEVHPTRVTAPRKPVIPTTDGKFEWPPVD